MRTQEVQLGGAKNSTARVANEIRASTGVEDGKGSVSKIYIELVITMQS